jgi:three-Cys-motif partner protein
MLSAGLFDGATTFTPVAEQLKSTNPLLILHDDGWNMTKHFTGGSAKTVAKLVILEEYLDIYTTILEKRWSNGLWYVDSHAGTGKTEIDDAGRLVDGSALRAIQNHSDIFEAFYLYELDKDHFTTLHQTLSEELGLEFDVYETTVPDEDFLVARSEDPKVVIMQMDSNRGVSFLADKANQNNHWFTFIDPKGLTARRDTIDTLIDRGNMDILINYQTTGVMRSAGADHAHGAVTRTIGDDDWSDAETPDEFVREYTRRIESSSIFNTTTKAMESPRDARCRFDLVFASKNTKARDLMEDRMNQEGLWEKAYEETGQSGLSKWT